MEEHLHFQAEFCHDLLRAERRVLVFGEPGTGKSTLVRQLLQILGELGAGYQCLCADPGLPLFGIPGALNLGLWQSGAWKLCDYEALCSLDAGRFRLPLTTAISELLLRNTSAGLIIDAPGVVRGVAGAELLLALVRCAEIDTVLVVVNEGQQSPLVDELNACGAEILSVTATPAAHNQNKIQRARQRSQQWLRYMARAKKQSLCLAQYQLLGTPPPINAISAWAGRQVGLLLEGQLKTMGEVIALQGQELHVSLASEPGHANQLLIRDALFKDGLLRSAKPHRRPVNEKQQTLDVGYLPESSNPSITKVAVGRASAVARIGPATATLVNGIFGDPLLHLQLHHQRRSLLFDLGDAGRLAARTAHQVTDVFFSHTHADHIGGFLWFLRSRIGDLPACRCYGPPGLARQIAGLANGILWDRIEDRAPKFEVREWHGDRLYCYRVVAGASEILPMDTLPLKDGLLWQEPAFAIRATALDHGTLVLAYAFEPSIQIKVRREQLLARDLTCGNWLQQLKQQVFAGNMAAEIALPNGARQTVASLAEQLLLIEPGKKLVYATDFADTPSNREKLAALAANAHTLFCESSFMSADSEQARRTQHLTTNACAAIANTAGVKHLMPFHFSKRYEKRPQQVYRELHSICRHTVIPQQLSS